MTRSLLRGFALMGAVGLGACNLAVINPNSPETKRVLATPSDVESLIGTQYLRFQGVLYGTGSNQWGMAAVQSFEDFSSLSNNCMGQRIGIPRASNDNAVGNGCAGEQSNVYYRASEVMRTATNVLNRFHEPTFTLGSPAQDNRARAFAEFLRGLTSGYLALVYDSAAVISEQMSAEDAGSLLGYSEVLDTSLAALQRAIDYATAPAAGTDGFPLPGTWIPTANVQGPSATEFTTAEFVKLMRSYRARFRASVARTVAERNAVNWDLVIADAQNGITADHMNGTGTNNGGASHTWLASWTSATTWHQMTPFVAGMADGSDGAYAAWSAVPIANRPIGGTIPYFQVSPDKRWPQGATRPDQQADFDLASCGLAGAVCKRYFVNRETAQDSNTGDSWGWSNYDYARFYPWRYFGSASGLTPQNGPLPFMTLAEIDMLQAEGLIRKGSFSAAAALINKTRTTFQGNPNLPAITTFDGTSPVPGGADCVPKVPVNVTPGSGGTVQCGNMFEAMKYEKRIEGLMIAFMQFFFDGRGWGDLPDGTPYDWAPPYQDLLARGRVGTQIYSTGGPYHSAVRGGYGW
jgi:hypothetical protein